MTRPNDKPRRNPADRMRAIMSAMQKQRREEMPLVDRLPKAGIKTEKVALGTTRPVSATPSGASVNNPQPGGYQFLPAFWTISSLLSLTVNVILIAVLLGVLRGLGSLNFGGIGTGLLGGLYSNFEKMDDAHIKTTIPVQDN